MRDKCLNQVRHEMTKKITTNLKARTWGGRRSRSGRKRIHSKGVAHRTRETVNIRRPVHVNFRYKINIRNKELLKILKRALFNSRRMGLRILHYSVQRNHMHFILEADDNRILESGMRSLTITLAKGINQGSIQIKRYHLHVLKTVRVARNAIRYVLFNEQKHTGKKVVGLSPYSSLHALDAKAIVKKAKMTFIVSSDVVKFFRKDVEKRFLAKKAFLELIC
jgi:hypothetical protein